MGMDLQILPLYNQRCDFSHDLLGFHRDYDIFNEIEEIEKELGIEISDEGINTYVSRNEEEYEDSHYGKTLNTPYGNKLKYVLAEHLKKAINPFYEKSSWKNKAIIAFVNELPDDLPVYLYWN